MSDFYDQVNAERHDDYMRHLEREEISRGSFGPRIARQSHCWDCGTPIEARGRCDVCELDWAMELKRRRAVGLRESEEREEMYRDADLDRS